MLVDVIGFIHMCLASPSIKCIRDEVSFVFIYSLYNNTNGIKKYFFNGDKYVRSPLNAIVCYVVLLTAHIDDLFQKC